VCKNTDEGTPDAKSPTPRTSTQKRLDSGCSADEPGSPVSDQTTVGFDQSQQQQARNEFPLR
jgi:hypothetical protein